MEMKLNHSQNLPPVCRSQCSLLTGVSAAFNLICSLHMWLKVFLNIMTDPIVEVSPYCAQRSILPTKYQILANPPASQAAMDLENFAHAALITRSFLTYWAKITCIVFHKYPNSNSFWHFLLIFLLIAFTCVRQWWKDVPCAHFE